VTDKIGRILAIWFGCGLVPKAPGTMGTLGALPLYLLLAQGGSWGIAAGVAVLLPISFWAAGVVVKQLDHHDPQIIVIDEVVGVLVACIPHPVGWKEILFAFVAFRVFDMTKPFPARRAEKLPRGYGVVMDDVFAGVWAAGFLLLIRYTGLLA
jgi:phosphatidylglycerophosphatase A